MSDKIIQAIARQIKNPKDNQRALAMAELLVGLEGTKKPNEKKSLHVSKLLASVITKEKCTPGHTAARDGCEPDDGKSGGKTDTGSKEKPSATSSEGRKGIDRAPPPQGEKIVPPPCCLNDPNPHEIDHKTKQAMNPRVGVSGLDCPPPPDEIPRLPNLTEGERKAEHDFIESFLEDPKGYINWYEKKRNHVVGGTIAKHKNPEALAKAAIKAGIDAKVGTKKDGTLDGSVTFSGEGDVLNKFYQKHGVTASPQYEVGDAPNIFNTDDAKMLSMDYNPVGEDNDTKKKHHAIYNTAVHQAANAIAKKAFVAHLDKLPEDKKSVLVTSGGVACHGIDTSILMFDGSIRAVQNVLEGDLVMGPDSQPRTVITTHRGVGPLFRITPKRGIPFVVNDEHVLSLKEISRNGSHKEREEWHVVNIKVSDLLRRGKVFREKRSFLYRTDVEFNETEVPLDPYFLGLWLGDGTHCLPSITSADIEIEDYLMALAESTDYVKLVKHPKKDNKSSVYQISLIDSRPVGWGEFAENPITAVLRGLGVFRDKHVPRLYIINSRKVRLELLAGLLDSDGSYDQEKGCFDFCTKIKQMADEICFLVNSLGFHTTVKIRNIKNPWTGKMGVYYRLTIGGNTLNEIPTKIPRKQATVRSLERSNGSKSRSCLHTGYNIETIGAGEFFGFTLDGDHLYLLGDFTVTHNSGKGFALDNTARHVVDQAGAVWDAAGEQNSSENEWVLNECKKRGIRPTFTYVHSDPHDCWENPKRGVIERAGKKGRLPDARLFADSYDIGAKNFKTFAERHKHEADFIYIDNNTGGAPKIVDDMPHEALTVDAEKLYARATRIVEGMEGRIKPELLRAATRGQGIWGKPKKETEHGKVLKMSVEKAGNPNMFRRNDATAAVNDYNIIVATGSKADMLRIVRDNGGGKAGWFIADNIAGKTVGTKLSGRPGNLPPSKSIKRHIGQIRSLITK